MSVIDLLHAAQTLDDFDQLVNGPDWKAHLASLVEASDADEVERFRHAVSAAKNRLSPEHTCPELLALKELIYAGGDPQALRPLLTRVAELRTALPTRRHERLFAQVESAVGQALSPGLGGTGYSNRARRARDLFTEHAGKTKIDGAKADAFGNAAGTAYDLGRDGAFAGHTVHVLHLYSGEGFDFKKPAVAFERKGFRVERLTKVGSAPDLKKWLADAQQLWLISSMKTTLTKDHVEVIRDFWRRGGGLYVWGDNAPYFADANVLLNALFGPDLKMRGDVPGGKVVREVSPDRRGFLAHLITTGLEHLFEGITVASLTEGEVEGHGFAPLMYGSAGNLITAVREPSPNAGAVVIDGAFTRLYCQWDEAGSARYVCNAACFLAAMALPEDEPEPSPAAAKEETLAYDAQGAFAGTCDLTGETPRNWLVLSVGQLADALRNTSDFVLTDPLGFGAANAIFSDHLYDEQMGPWIVAQGADPFTRKPVVECLPLVDLSHDGNLREFTRVLRKCLMGGKYLPTAARLLFFAVVDRMLDGGRREAWEYLRGQCLRHFTTTADFSEMGKKMPLLSAMIAYFSPVTDPMAQIRKSFPTVGVIGRTLLREGRSSQKQVRLIARRSLLKSLVGDAVAASKTEAGAPDLLGLLYDNFHGIPTLNGGRIVEDWPAFAHDVSTDRARLERVLETPLLTPAEQTTALHALTSLDLRQYTAESAVERLVAHVPAFEAVWNGAGAAHAVKALNDRFAAYAGPTDWDDVHLTQLPPFATTYGPSVYRCVCGHEFGDPAAELTDEALLHLGHARQQHFRAVYRAPEGSAYPAAGTLHYNLHRAVQRVVKEQFTDAMAFEEEMIGAVAAYLRRDAKGFVCDPRLPRLAREALSSYLALRRAGQPHPEGVLTLRVKAERERDALAGSAHPPCSSSSATT